MNEGELAQAVFAAIDVLRVETLPSYAVGSDRDWLDRYLAGDPKPDIELKRAWLEQIAVAARREHPWRRLRSVPEPVPDYIRYQAEWSYVDNVAAGEQIRVVGADEHPDEALGVSAWSDFYVLDGDVISMTYDADGRFLHARREDKMSEGHRVAEIAWAAYSRPFEDWWASRTDLHREVTT